MPRKLRSQLIDPSHTCLHHLFSRCTRRLFLLADDQDQRKRYAAGVVALLIENFAIDLGSYSFMDNHVHLVVRMDPKTAERWTPREVVERWGRSHPPHGRPPTEAWVQDRLKDRKWISKHRKALASVSQLMKDFKQRITQWINRLEGTRGTAWEGRFGSRPIESVEDLIGVNAYVDLNPVVAGVVDQPEMAVFTSIYERFARAQGMRTRRDVPFIGLVPMGNLGRAPGREIKEADRLRPLVPGSREDDYLELVRALARVVRTGVQDLTAATGACATRLSADVDRVMTQVLALFEDPRLRPD